MKKMKFNEAQQKAIDTIDKNVLVVAGAGTGKTQVLTHRFINIIKNGGLHKEIALESILAITFTKKATREMISRIESEIAKLSFEDEEYRSLENHIPFLNIYTIDGFLNRIIKENSMKIGINSNYSIIEEYDAEKILDETISKVLDEEIESDENVLTLMYDLKIERVTDFSRELKGVYKEIVNKNYDLECIVEKTLTKKSDSSYEEIVMLLKDTCEYLLEKKYANGRQAIISYYKKGEFEKLNTDDFLTRHKLLFLFRQKFDDVKKFPLDEKTKFLEKLDAYICDMEVERYSDDYRTLEKLVYKIDEEYKRLKLKKNVMEFSDLKYYANELFNDDEILKKYQDEFKYVMIDEYQDTDRLQRDLFYKLCSTNKKLDRNNLFVVGDPKQSIYAFRGSDLDIFYETREDIKNCGGEIVELDINYRSKKGIIDYTNTLFNQIMRTKYDKIKAYDESDDDFIRAVEYDKDISSEEKTVVSAIQNLIDNGVNPSDIAVLFRSTNKLSNLERELEMANIPFINPKSKEFFNTREIRDIILFFKMLNLPDDESVFGVLRSDFFLIKDEDIFSIMNENSLYENIMNYDGENKRIRRASEIFKKIFSKKDEVPVSDILSEFLIETKYYEFLAGSSNTSQSQENVKKFENMTLEYVNEHKGLVNEFFDYILELSKRDEREAETGGEDACKLMTIHASKGLEFPYVIFYDSMNRPNFERGNILITKNGIGMNIGENSMLRESVAEDIDNTELEERQRLLYVAITRAERGFLFVYSADEMEKLKGNEKSKTFLKDLLNIENYTYELFEQKVPERQRKSRVVQLITDESETGEFSGEIVRKKETGSITHFNTFMRCRREYFLRYKLKLGKIESLEEIYDYDEKDDYISAAEFGTLVHKMIENLDYIESYEDFIKSENIDIEKIDFKRLERMVDNYKRHDISKNREFEVNFYLALENGYMTGSIDELINDEDIFVVDFKTNRVKNEAELVKIYKPQLMLYSIAVEKMYEKKPKKSIIHFLDIDKIVEIEYSEWEKYTLIKNIEEFLKFIRLNEDIKSYEKCFKCNEFCEYKNICDRMD